MRTEKQIEIEMLDSVRDLTESLYQDGHLSDANAAASQQVRLKVGAKPLKLVLNKFDASKISQVPVFAPEQIKSIREHAGASQSVMALFLGVETVTVSQWERGARKPDGPARRLLYLIDQHGLEHVR